MKAVKNVLGQIVFWTTFAITFLIIDKCHGQNNTSIKAAYSYNTTDTASLKTTRTNLQALYGNTGGLYFNAISNKWRVWNGTIWVDLLSTGGSGNLSGTLTSPLIPYATGAYTLANSTLSFTVGGANTFNLNSNTGRFQTPILNVNNSSDPSSLNIGDYWYNSTQSLAKIRTVSGNQVILTQAGNGLTQTGSLVGLGGSLTSATAVDINTQSLEFDWDDGAAQSGTINYQPFTGISILEYNGTSKPGVPVGFNLGAGTLTISDGVGIGTAGQVLQSNAGAGVQWVTPSTSVPAGSNTQVQFNNSGLFGASSSLTWTNGTGLLHVTGTGSNGIDIGGSTTGRGMLVTNSAITMAYNATGMVGNNGLSFQNSSTGGGLFNIHDTSNNGDFVFSCSTCILGTSKTTFIIRNIPTSSTGLPSGAIWSNAGVLTIVP